MAAMNNLDGLAAWANLDGVHNDGETPRGSFYNLIGSAKAAHPRLPGNVEIPEINAVLPKWVTEMPKDGEGKHSRPNPRRWQISQLLARCSGSAGSVPALNSSKQHNRRKLHNRRKSPC